MTVLTQALAQALVDEQGLDVVIPDVYTSIEDWAFYDNALTSAVIPDSVTSIGNYAFSGNKLTNIVIPGNVISISRSAFFNNQLTSIDLGSGVTSIGNDAFSGNQLTSVFIPDSVTSIGDDAHKYFTGNWTGHNAFKNNPLTVADISEDLDYYLPYEVTAEKDLFPKETEIIVRHKPPTDISITANSFNENIVGGTKIANFEVADESLSDLHSFALVAGDGDTDNSAFSIDGYALKINTSPDYEIKNSYSIRVKATDKYGLAHEKPFKLSVNNLDIFPTIEWSIDCKPYPESDLTGDTAWHTLVDSDNNLYIAGETKKWNRTGALDVDTYLVKINAEGKVEWSHIFDSDPVWAPFGDPYYVSYEQPLNLQEDLDGYIYLLGTTNGNFNGNSNAGGYDVWGRFRDIFVAKMHKNGDIQSASVYDVDLTGASVGPYDSYLIQEI